MSIAVMGTTLTKANTRTAGISVLRTQENIPSITSDREPVQFEVSFHIVSPHVLLEMLIIDRHWFKRVNDEIWVAPD
jgi:hypothetical protein